MIEALEGRKFLATHIWTGAVSDLWSNPANWANGSPAGDPQAVLSFPTSGTKTTTKNDLAGLTVSAIDFSGGNYALSGNTVTLVQGPQGIPRIHMDAAAANTIVLGLDRTATNIGVTFDIAGGSTLHVSGVIGGGAAANSIAKDGGGTLVLAGANTFADGVLINAGTLNLRDSTALGTTSAGANGRTTINGGTLEVEGSLFVTETLVQGPAGGTLRNVSGNSTWAGEVLLTFTDLTAQVAGGFLSVIGPVSDDSPGAPRGIVKSGFGRLNLTAANSYRGTTVVSEGRLNINNAAALGTADGGTVVGRGATLELQGFITVASEPLTLEGAGPSSPESLGSVAGNNVWQGPITLVNTPVMGVLSGTLTLSGVVGGSTGMIVGGGGPGSGKLILTNANTYTGETNVAGSGAVLNIRHPLALGPAAGPSVIVQDGGALELELQGANTINRGLLVFGAGVGGTGALLNVSGTNVWAGAVNGQTENINVGVSAGQLTIGGAISGRSVTKVGDGALFLAGTQEGALFQFRIFVNGGSLFVNNVPGFGVFSRAYVNTGRLGGTGYISSIIMNGGVLGPGVGAGRLRAQEAFLNSDSVFDVDLNGATAGTTYDQLLVSAAPQPGGSTLNARLRFFPLSGTSFKIIDNLSQDFVRRTFIGLPQGATIATSFGTLRINYAGGDGNDVVLTTINTISKFPDRSVTPVIDEGGVATVTGTISDPDRNDVFFLDIDWGDGKPIEHRNFPPGSNGKQVELTHRYDDDGQYPIHLSWHDNAGEGNSDTLTTTVRNVAPVIAPVDPVRLPPSGNLRHLVTFTDPGRDTWTASIDFGDGSGLQVFDVRGDSRLLLQHRYTKPGNYTVTIAIADDDGGIGTSSVQVRG